METYLLIHLIKFLQRMWGPKSTSSQSLSTYTCGCRAASMLWKTDANFASVLLFGLANTTLMCSLTGNENLETEINHLIFYLFFNASQENEPKYQVYSSNFYGNNAWSSC